MTTRSRRAAGHDAQRPRPRVVNSRRTVVTGDLADLVQRASIEMAAPQNDTDNTKATNTPGRELAFARERLSLSLEEISRRTKIGMPYLVAIENDEVKKLPGHFYARGFLRAYAHEVHCDPDDIVRRFGIVEEHTESMPPIDESFHLPATIELDDRRIARRVQLLVLAILVSGGFYVASGHPIHLPLMARRAATNNTLAPPAPVAAPSVALPAVATSGEAPAQTTPPPPSTGPLSIEVHATQECWLSATADGERVIYRTLSAGETARIEGREEIVLRVGDPAALSYAINGAAGKPLGESGEAVTIRVTPNNYREYLSSQTSTERTGGGDL